MEGSDETGTGDAVPKATLDLAPLERLRYELELVQEDLTALQSEQEAALARGAEVKLMMRLARLAAELRARHSCVRQEILQAERSQSER
jgi:hypothetical protein